MQTFFYFFIIVRFSKNHHQDKHYFMKIFSLLMRQQELVYIYIYLNLIYFLSAVFYFISYFFILKIICIRYVLYIFIIFSRIFLVTK